MRPHKWNPSKDADACVECGKPFKKGDSVFSDVAVNVHVTCVDSYRKTLTKLFGYDFNTHD